MQRHVQGRLGQSVTGRAHGIRCVGVTRLVDISERRICDVGQLGGLSNHLVVTTLGTAGQSQLIPDVHPVTVLSVDALTTDLDLDHVDHLFTGVIQPTGISRQGLANLGQSHLQVRSVSKITVTADCALHTSAEVSLSVEGLFNGLHGEVRVTTIGHLPEGDLRVASQVDILGTVSNELH